MAIKRLGSITILPKFKAGQEVYYNNGANGFVSVTVNSYWFDSRRECVVYEVRATSGMVFEARIDNLIGALPGPEEL